MKINITNFVIAIAISALLTYGLWSIEGNSLRNTISVGSFMLLSSTLALMLGVSFHLPRAATNIKVVSGVFFGIGLLINATFALMTLSQASYIIASGIAFLSFVLVARSIYAAEQ